MARIRPKRLRRPMIPPSLKTAIRSRFTTDHFILSIRVVMAFNSRTGIWSGDPNHFWTIFPGQAMRLEFPGIGPFVGNLFHFFAVSSDSSVAWGSQQALSLPTSVRPTTPLAVSRYLPKT